MTLNIRQRKFAQHYEGNATDAAIKAGYSEKTAYSQGQRLLNHVEVAAAIEAKQKRREVRADIKATDIIQHFWELGKADPNELIEHRRACCRHCHGKKFGYQRTQGEMARDRRAHKRLPPKKREEFGPFEVLGGIGFDPRKPPNPKCPECFGEGESRVFAKDTRNLSPAGRMLYAGTKQTKDGLEIKLADQAAAMVTVGKLIGAFTEKTITEHAGKVEHEHSGSVENKHVLAGQALKAFADDLVAAGLGHLSPDGDGKQVDSKEANATL